LNSVHSQENQYEKESRSFSQRLIIFLTNRVDVNKDFLDSKSADFHPDSLAFHAIMSATKEAEESSRVANNLVNSLLNGFTIGFQDHRPLFRNLHEILSRAFPALLGA
jgi:hypothetical protein